MLVLETELRRVEAVAFSPCGRFVAAGGLGVELWSLGLEQVWRWGWEKRPGVATQYVRKVEFHPSGEWLYAGVPHFNLYQLRVADAEANELQPSGTGIVSFAVSPKDGAVIGITSYDLTCWRSPLPGQGFTFRSEQSHIDFAYVGTSPLVTGLPDGRIVTHEGQNGLNSFVIRRTPGGEPECVHPSRLRLLDNLRASPDGRYLAVTRENTMRVWSLANLKWPPRVLTNDTRKAITDYAFHPGGRFLATASNDRGVTLWDLETWQPMKTFDWHEGRMRSLAFSPDGLIAVAGSDTGQVVLFDVDV